MLHMLAHPARAASLLLGRPLTTLLPTQILVNNAGLGRNNAHLFDGNTASWVEMVSTNVLGVCMCAREAVQVSPGCTGCFTIHPVGQ